MAVYTVYPASHQDNYARSQHSDYATARSGVSPASKSTNAAAQYESNTLGQLYDGSTYYVTEALFRFDTSVIPDAETVTSVSMQVYLSGGNGISLLLEARADDFALLVNAGDYVAGADLAAMTLLSSYTLGVNETEGLKTFATSAAFVAHVDKSGHTDVLVHSARMRTGTAPTAGVQEDQAVLFVDHPTASVHPRLIVVTGTPADQTISPAGVLPGGGVTTHAVATGLTIAPSGVPPGGGVTTHTLTLATTPPRTGPYRVVFVARTPQAGGPPILAEIGQVEASGLTWTDELNRPGSIQFSVEARMLAPAVRTRMRDLFALPLEVVVVKGAKLMKHGFVQGWQGGSTLSVYAKGLLGYLEGMWVVADYLPVNTDLHTIAESLMTTWQAGTAGDYGITTGNFSSGVLGEGTYRGNERPNVLTEIQRLGARDDGFDVDVESLTFNDRRLRLYHPHKGADVSSRVIIDRTNIIDPGTMESVAPGDVATEAYVSSTSEDGTVLTAASVAPAARLQWGRWGVVNDYPDVKVQATLQAHADALLAPRAAIKLDVGPSFRARPGTEVTDFAVGDTVGYSYDFGLGLLTTALRVAQRSVRVPDDDSAETMSISGV